MLKMAISASMVRDLRGKTGAAMMDCKKALEAAGGDLEAAIDHLRKSGLKTAEKKADRDMSEGRVFSHVAEDQRSGALIAITCETDFVARTPDFEALLGDLSAHVLEHAPADLASLASQPWKGTDETVETALKATVGKLGENISIGNVARLANEKGYVGTYVHHDNKQGAIVSVTTGADADKAAAVLRDLCMHAVVFAPEHLQRSDVDAEIVEREKAIYMEEVSGKPAEIQEKIVNGKLEKFFATITLREQPWIKDDKRSVEKALIAELGEGTVIEAFSCFKIGG